MKIANIVIADDHGLVRSGLRKLIEDAGDMRVQAEAANGLELLALLREAPADLVLLDMAMPGLAGIDLIRHLIAQCGNLAILVLSMHNETQIVTRALKSGAAGYLTKDCSPELLIGALRKVLGGGRFIDPALVDSVVFNADPDSGRHHEQLSPREQQILRMISDGMRIGAIADRLHLSPKTVSTHKMRLMHKLELHTDADLFRYSLRQGA